MKKIGLGISLLLFAIALALCSSGMELFVLAIAAAGLLCSLSGYGEKTPHSPQ